MTSPTAGRYKQVAVNHYISSPHGKVRNRTSQIREAELLHRKMYFKFYIFLVEFKAHTI